MWELGSGYPTMMNQDAPKIVAVSPSKINGNNRGLIKGLVSRDRTLVKSRLAVWLNVIHWIYSVENIGNESFQC
jgi:hypothetical protein